uniref:Uncharacterized protein n=1 Tax=Arundo donax TaxID=35708 RepID=A0A0A9A3C3_ARUDO
MFLDPIDLGTKIFYHMMKILNMGFQDRLPSIKGFLEGFKSLLHHLVVGFLLDSIFLPSPIIFQSHHELVDLRNLSIHGFDVQLLMGYEARFDVGIGFRCF